MPQHVLVAHIAALAAAGQCAVTLLYAWTRSRRILYAVFGWGVVTVALLIAAGEAAHGLVDQVRSAHGAAAGAAAASHGHGTDAVLFTAIATVLVAGWLLWWGRRGKKMRTTGLWSRLVVTTLGATLTITLWLTVSSGMHAAWFDRPV